MSRLSAMALVLTLALGACGGGEEPLARNLLLISIDTLRPDHLGCYGSVRDTSPNLDALCRESVVFEQAISHAPSTLPSHASMLTSLPPQAHGASISRRQPLPDAAVTLAEVLSDTGFETVSYNDGSQLAPAWNLGQGFDLYHSTRGHHVVPRARFSGRVDEFLGWLDDRHGSEGREAPFFAFLHSYQVHHPYLPSEKDLARFEDTPYDGPLGRRISVRELRRIESGHLEVGTADRKFVEIAYDAEIRDMDRALGRLLSELRDRGRLDDTLILFTSDHGEEFGEHGQLGWHGNTLYDELLRVPLVVRSPDRRWAGKRIHQQVRLIDLAPTALDALGLEPPVDWWGTSLRPLLRGEAVEPLIAVAMIDDDRDRPVEAVRTGRWKWYRGRLFDLVSDPKEVWSYESDHPDLARSLREHLDSVRDAIRSSGRLSDRGDADGGPIELDAETVRELESLGYL